MDAIEAAVTKLLTGTGAGNANTLVGNRIYRGIAPVKTEPPYIVASFIGGVIHRVFSGRHLEEWHVQWDVIARFRGDASDARAIWDALVADLEDEALTVTPDTHIITRRTALPRETIEDDTIVISGDWMTEIQKA